MPFGDASDGFVGLIIGMYIIGAVRVNGLGKASCIAVKRAELEYHRVISDFTVMHVCVVIVDQRKRDSRGRGYTRSSSPNTEETRR